MSHLLNNKTSHIQVSDKLFALYNPDEAFTKKITQESPNPLLITNYFEMSFAKISFTGYSFNLKKINSRPYFRDGQRNYNVVKLFFHDDFPVAPSVNSVKTWEELLYFLSQNPNKLFGIYFSGDDYSLTPDLTSDPYNSMLKLDGGSPNLPVTLNITSSEPPSPGNNNLFDNVQIITEIDNTLIFPSFICADIDFSPNISNDDFLEYAFKRKKNELGIDQIYILEGSIITEFATSENNVTTVALSSSLAVLTQQKKNEIVDVFNQEFKTNIDSSFLPDTFDLFVFDSDIFFAPEIKFYHWLFSTNVIFTGESKNAIMYYTDNSALNLNVASWQNVALIEVTDLTLEITIGNIEYDIVDILSDENTQNIIAGGKLFYTTNPEKLLLELFSQKLFFSNTISEAVYESNNFLMNGTEPTVSSVLNDPFSAPENSLILNVPLSFNGPDIDVIPGVLSFSKLDTNTKTNEQKILIILLINILSVSTFSDNLEFNIVEQDDFMELFYLNKDEELMEICDFTDVNNNNLIIELRIINTELLKIRENEEEYLASFVFGNSANIENIHNDIVEEFGFVILPFTYPDYKLEQVDELMFLAKYLSVSFDASPISQNVLNEFVEINADQEIFISTNPVANFPANKILLTIGNVPNLFIDSVLIQTNQVYVVSCERVLDEFDPGDLTGILDVTKLTELESNVVPVFAEPLYIGNLENSYSFGDIDLHEDTWIYETEIKPEFIQSLVPDINKIYLAVYNKSISYFNIINYCNNPNKAENEENSKYELLRLLFLKTRVFNMEKIVVEKIQGHNVTNYESLYLVVQGNVFEFAPIIVQKQIDESIVDNIISMEGINSVYVNNENSGKFEFEPNVLGDINEFIFDNVEDNSIEKFEFVDEVYVSFNFFHPSQFYNKFKTFKQTNEPEQSLIPVTEPFNLHTNLINVESVDYLNFVESVLSTDKFDIQIEEKIVFNESIAVKSKVEIFTFIDEFKYVVEQDLYLGLPISEQDIDNCKRYSFEVEMSNSINILDIQNNNIFLSFGKKIIIIALAADETYFMILGNIKTEISQSVLNTIIAQSSLVNTFDTYSTVSEFFVF